MVVAFDAMLQTTCQQIKIPSVEGIQFFEKSVGFNPNRRVTATILTGQDTMVLLRQD